MKRFAELFRALDATTSTNDKIAALADYFTAVPAADAVWALVLLTGKRRRRVVTSRTLRHYFLQRSEVPEWLFTECYAHVGDSAETIGLLLQEQERTDLAMANLPLHQFMSRELAALKDQEDEARCETVHAWWRAFDADDVFVLNKIMTGGFRVGVSRKLVVRSLSKAFGIEPAVLLHRLMGHWEPTAAFCDTLIQPADGDVVPSRPYPFFLASPLEEDLTALGSANCWRAEWKWDGIRCQIIRRQGETYLWSRGEDLVTERFPEVAEACAELPDGTVLDGELLAWSDGGPLPFSRLQKRIGRRKPGKRILKQAPVSFLAYDLMEWEGNDLREQPYDLRRKHLRGLIAHTDHPRLLLSEEVPFSSWETLVELRERSRDRGVEGLMIKRAESPYRTGRQRGDWWKFKVDPYTLDAVLIYAQAGSGRRANLFTDYTFALWNGDALVPFAKAYSGLDQSEIGSLDRWIRRNTLEKFGPVRSVNAEQVFEIAFEGIALSNRHKSGVAVRFPRIIRWRQDKQACEADSLDAAKALLP